MGPERSYGKNPYQDYLDFLDLNEEELRGKIILDVGAGFADFGSGVESKRLAAIVNLDPRYQEKRMFRVLQERHPNFFPSKLVAGVAEDLPFVSGKFDLVVSKATVPLQKWTQDESHHVLTELIRVTKPGGKIILAYAQFGRNSYTWVDSDDRISPRIEFFLDFKDLKKIWAEKIKVSTNFAWTRLTMVKF